MNNAERSPRERRLEFYKSIGNVRHALPKTRLFHPALEYQASDFNKLEISFAQQIRSLRLPTRVQNAIIRANMYGERRYL